MIQKCRKCGIMIDREAMLTLGIPVTPPWPESDLCTECGPKFVDIADFEEDERIKIIGHTVTCYKKIIVVLVENSEKAERYIKKLSERYPNIEISKQFPGLVPDTVSFKVGPKS